MIEPHGLTQCVNNMPMQSKTKLKLLIISSFQLRKIANGYTLFLNSAKNINNFNSNVFNGTSSNCSRRSKGMQYLASSRKAVGVTLFYFYRNMPNFLIHVSIIISCFWASANRNYCRSTTFSNDMARDFNICFSMCCCWGMLLVRRSNYSRSCINGFINESSIF